MRGRRRPDALLRDVLARDKEANDRADTADRARAAFLVAIHAAHWTLSADQAEALERGLLAAAAEAYDEARNARARAIRPRPASGIQWLIDLFQIPND